MQFKIITQLGDPIFVRFSDKFYDILRQVTITTMHHFIKNKSCAGRAINYNGLVGYTYKFSNSEKESFELLFYPDINSKKIIMILNNEKAIYSVEEMENPEFHDSLRSKIGQCLQRIGILDRLVHYNLKEPRKRTL